MARAQVQVAPMSDPTGPSSNPPLNQQAQPAQPAVSATTAVAAPTKPGGNGNGSSDGDGASAGKYSGPTTPAVRRLAREHSIDLSMIAGSGHGGRVTREDVMKFVESGGAQAAQTQQGTATSAPSQQAPATQTPMPMTSAAQAQSAPAASSSAAASPVAQGDSLKQASPMRKAIAAQMTKALQVPVAYTVIEVDMSGVVALRNGNKTQYQAQEGIGLTYDAFVAKATVEALKRHSDFNATYTEEGHLRRQAINLGIAVAVEERSRRADHQRRGSAVDPRTQPCAARSRRPLARQQADAR